MICPSWWHCWGFAWIMEIFFVSIVAINDNAGCWIIFSNPLHMANWTYFTTTWLDMQLLSTIVIQFPVLLRRFYHWFPHPLWLYRFLVASHVWYWRVKQIGIPAHDFTYEKLPFRSMICLSEMVRTSIAM